MSSLNLSSIYIFVFITYFCPATGPSPSLRRMEEPRAIENELELILAGSKKPADLPLPLLKNITEEFSEQRIIGAGGFGTVYKGILRNGEVAVKRIKNSQTIDEKLFRREVSSLMKVNHQNIVRFLGFCSNTEHKAIEHNEDFIYAENRERILCFEYINNGSLEKYIADELRGPEWSTRYKIIKGICEGLEYLHTKKRMVHMDLKPANILIDKHMSAKITDFGLSRMMENLETKSSDRFSSLGYTAPEYLDGGKMSVKSDVYSLGVIIIELVTGRKGIPDNDNVLRKWRHRWHKSGKHTSFGYQQIAKLIKIGLFCQEKDAYKRPFISEIIRDIHEMENMDTEISNANNCTVGQISPYFEDDMLGVEPLELFFPFELNKQISCTLELTNDTNAYIAFIIRTSSPLPYCMLPGKGIMRPQSKHSAKITLQPLDKAPQDRQYTGDFIIRSTKVNDNLTDEDITEDTFKKEKGKVVDEVTLTVAYEAKVPKVDLSLELLTISGTGNLSNPEESNVPPAEVESTINLSTSDDLIQFDPPELVFPLLPNKKVVASIKIVNITEFYVGFNIYVLAKNTAYYITSPVNGILAPQSTKIVMVRREVKEDALIDVQSSDRCFVWNSIMADGMEDIDLSHYMDDEDSKELPIVLKEICPCTSNELIQFDPPELSFPFLPNKDLVSSVNIVNITDCYVGFNALFFIKNVAVYVIEPDVGILPPRSTQRMVIKREPKQRAVEDMELKDKFFVWNMIVAEGVKANNLNDYMDVEDCKVLPVILKEISPSTSGELIQFEPPELRFTYMKNKTLLSSVDIVNITEYYVGFNKYALRANAALYVAEPVSGILPPRCTQRLVVKRIATEKELEGMHCEDKFFVWNGVVDQGVKASDLHNYMTDEGSKELPIILRKISSSTSNVLIQIEPPMLCFPFLPKKSLLSSIKIVNITDYFVGFNTFEKNTNVALYNTEPPYGVLPPRSTKELVITRVANKEVLENMQCKDSYFVWSSFVTEGVEVSDLIELCDDAKESKELPIVFTETSKNELIQFDPSELCFPLWPNKSVLSSTKIVNITDHHVGFSICTKKSNLARYYTNPSEGILPPQSAQVLMVTRIAEEKELENMQCDDKYLVWNGIVAEDVKASNVLDNMSEANITELAIVPTKPSSSALNELIQSDLSEICFPFLANKKVMSSIKIVNITDYKVGFNTYSSRTNAAWYHTEPPRGILPPGSTQKLMVTRELKKDALEDMQFNDKYFVWNSIVSEAVKDSDLRGYMADQESKELPIVLDKISSSTSDELIQLDPTELCIPLLLEKMMLFRVNIVNTTDFYVAFNAYTVTRDAARYKESRETGILPPRSTKKVIVAWVTRQTELEDRECTEEYFVWNRVVTENVQAGDIISYMAEEECKKLPFILNKTSPYISNELIQFDPPKLSLPFMPNRTLVFLVNIVNSTDYYVGFNRCNQERNVGWYYVKPSAGAVMPPQSTQRLVVKWVPDDKKQDDMQWEDKLFLWNCFVSEGVEVSDMICEGNFGESKELPIVFKKASLCESNELIQFDPPELCFPFLPNKRVSMICLLKIVNVTDHSIGFNIWFHDDNSACYQTEPGVGILSPRGTQTIKVKRTPKLNTPQDMQCKDKIFVWRGIVTEGVEVSDVLQYWKDEDKELSVVLTKPGESSSM